MTSALGQLLFRLHGAAPPCADDLADRQLLERFLALRDQAAFEALVRRHGPMVLGVCRRLLHDPHAIEDVFQATFLVLVRRAASIRQRELLGNWLYGVAYRTALEERGRTARRHSHEQQVKDMPHPADASDPAHRECLAVLDYELSRLPEKYRVPMVLCELEGRTRKDAARQLRLPEGTLSSRLATARRLLARRLSGRGLALSAGTVATVLATARDAVSAVPVPLRLATAKAATWFAAGKAASTGARAQPHWLKGW